MTRACVVCVSWCGCVHVSYRSCSALQGLLGRECSGIGHVLSMRLDVHDAATPSPTPKKEEEEEEAAADQAEEGTDVSRNAMPQHLHTHTIIHSPPQNVRPLNLWPGARYQNNNLVDSRNPNGRFVGTGDWGGETRGLNISSRGGVAGGLNMSSAANVRALNISSQLSLQCSHELHPALAARPGAALSSALSRLDISPLHSFNRSMAAVLKHESAALGTAADPRRSTVISLRRNMHVAAGVGARGAGLGSVHDLTSSLQSLQSEVASLAPVGQQMQADADARRTLAALGI